jgi:glycosyltransferase involved in cell wall biosynthesis
MTRPYLTVLTSPIIPAPRRLYQRLRAAARIVVKPDVPVPQGSPYPGHYALVRSVVEGLHSVHADFNFNPRTFGDLARVVYAPANEALLQAIALKQEGAVDYLVAGPVNALFPDEGNGILKAPEIDLLIVPSEWTTGFYRDFPELAHKIRVCPCGVDSERWKPTGREKERLAVVYWKSGHERFCETVEAIVRRCGLEPLRVRSRPGEYNFFEPAEYRDALDRALVAVFLSEFETQGIALAESWSMDVPTLVWDPRSQAEWRGHTFISGSSAPYLSPATGVAWRTIDDLEPVLSRALRSLRDFQPRAWVQAHMTDAICSETLYKLIRMAASSSIRH